MTSSIYKLKQIGKLDRPPEPELLYGASGSPSWPEPEVMPSLFEWLRSLFEEG